MRLNRIFWSVSGQNRRLTDRFTKVYENNEWGDNESASGAGSRRDSPAVQQSLDALDHIVRTYCIKSVVDLPCGDFNWIPHILGVHRKLKYRGFDIVPSLIARNRERFPSHRFDLLDVTSGVPPRADLIFSKDLVNHLMHLDVTKVFLNFKRSGSFYLLMSNNFGWQNAELDQNAGGTSRHLDVMAEPFLFPTPIWRTNYLGLWRLSDVDEKALQVLKARLSVVD